MYVPVISKRLRRIPKRIAEPLVNKMEEKLEGNKRHTGYSETYATVTMGKARRKSNFVHVWTEYTRGHFHMYIQGSPAEINSPAHWNLINPSMTDQLPLLSLSSILRHSRRIALSSPQGTIRRAF